MTDQLQRWRGRTALITGASAGIGAATARLLAPLGMRLVLAARRADRLEALREELLAAHGPAGCQVGILGADLSRTEDIERMFQVVRQDWGGVDVLINNAGGGHSSGLVEAGEADLQRMLDVNIRAVTWCMREAMRDMEGREHAAIINISSLAGHRLPSGSTNNSFYAATKHALRGLSEGVRMELVAKKSPIKLGIISPGLVVTEFHQAADPRGKGMEYPFQPLVAEDVAGAVLYMLSTPPHVQISDILLRSVYQPF